MARSRTRRQFIVALLSPRAESFPWVVAQWFQRRGIGRALTGSLVLTARDRGIEVLTPDARAWPRLGHP